MTAIDHRRAVADRNRAAILDAVEQLLNERQALNMAALAQAAGVSRPTLYAHFKTLGEVMEAAVERAVVESLSALEAAQPEVGPADEALGRMIEASWQHLAKLDGLARGAAEHLPMEQLHRAHGPLMALTMGVFTRGQRDGTFRSDLPPDWLARVYTALVHAADEMARSKSASRKDALPILKTSLLDLLRNDSTEGRG